MEILWKWLSLCLGLLLVGLCNGFPINLEDTNAEHTQLLTGLVAVLLTVCSIVFLAGCLCCQRRNGFKEFRDSPVVASVASNLDHGQVNPMSNGEFTIFTPLSPPLYNNNVFLANEQVITRTLDDYVYGDIDVSFWFDPSKKDFPRSKLKYIKELGRGWFGKVVEGAAQDLDSSKSWSPVVVRILDAASNARQRVLFLNDASIYLAPHHPNLLCLKGRCVSAAPLLLLQEACPLGDLKAHLKTAGAEHRALQWCCEVTSAIRHLHDHALVHHDLAARNCLLTESLTLKVGDYGLGPYKYPEDYYKGGEPLIPVRWRSPESLECTLTTIQPKKMTPEANVWSLGVVMWEICENGAQPYGELDDDEVISRVFGAERLRLEKPSRHEMYTDYVFRLIHMCWSNVDTRPKVSQIDMMLSDLLQVYKNTQNSLPNTGDFEKRWDSLKPNSIVKTDNFSVSINMEPDEINISKPMSPSMNNLHGSLDNLADSQPMESWLENVASETRDPHYVRGLSDAIKTLDTALELENISTGSEHSTKPNIDFKLGPSIFSNDTNKLPDSPNQNDSLTDSMIFKQPGSSESETEEENWRKKVERGAYSEKVKLKSRSVADLMVLTHVDYSESESETPLPSLDYRANKNGRKSNLENASLNFSSEGNLLSVENTFEEELRKLQLERRDSLLFVPDSGSCNNSNLSLLHELNSPTEIKPANQVFNVFNVTIDKFGPLGASSSKLSELISINEDIRSLSRQDSENKSDLGYATLHNSERNSDFGSVDGEQLLEDRIGCIKNEIEERLKNCELMGSESAKSVNNSHNTLLVQVENKSNKTESNEELTNKSIGARQNLPDIIASLDQEQTQNSVDLIESSSLQTNTEVHLSILKEEIVDLCKKFIEKESASALNINTNQNVIPHRVENCSPDHRTTVSLPNRIEKTVDTPCRNVPKLSDIIKNNKDLTNILISSDKQNKQTEVVRDTNLKESQIVPDFCSENVETVKSSSSNVDFSDIEDFFIMKISSARDISRKASVGSSSSCSSREQVFRDSFVPELKENFVKGPKIEVVSPPLKREGSNARSEHLELSDTEKVQGDDESDSASRCSDDDASINSDSGGVVTESTEKEADEINYFSSEDDELDLSEENEDMDENEVICPEQILNEESVISEKDPHVVLTNFLNEERKHASSMLSSEDNDIEPEPTSIDSLVDQNILSLDDNLPPPPPFLLMLDQTQNDLTPEHKPKVQFDLSKDQEEMLPNSLTHISMLTSTPFGKKHDLPLPSQSPYSSLFSDAPGKEEEEEELEFSSNFAPLESQTTENPNKLNYSLETWDNFLGKSFDSNRGSNENLFDSFTSEPQSMLFLEDDKKGLDVKEGSNVKNGTFAKNETFALEEGKKNGTFIMEDKKDGTFVKEDKENGTFIMEDKKDGTFLVEDRKDGTFIADRTGPGSEESNAGNSTWESGGGWFLHPQSHNDKLSGNIEPQPSTSKGSYVGFGMDDEIMAAIRNELLEKLPHAQGASHETVKEEEEVDQTERNEVFLRYNVYNTPLSPIPEEDSFEDNDDDLPVTDPTPKLDESDDSDWSDQVEPDDPPILSSQTNESPLRVPNHRHTPSQDSCCSNDTLFNLEDFACTYEKETCHGKDTEDIGSLNDTTFYLRETNVNNKETDQKNEKKTEVNEETVVKILNESEDASVCKEISEPTLKVDEISESNYVSTNDFLDNERNHTSSVDMTLSFVNKQVAPLPSPEDKPWKSLPASLLTYDKFTHNSKLLEHIESPSDSFENNSSETLNSEQEQTNDVKEPEKVQAAETTNTEDLKTELVNQYENIDTDINEKHDQMHLYTTICEPVSTNNSTNTMPVYENLENPSDIFNEADYVNIINIENIENTKNKDIPVSVKDEQEVFEDVPQQKGVMLIENNVETDHDIFGVLTDIRFNGPLDNQLMSTSFSESNEVDEQDWDSGSDTRSSSSGEFIWKEGEHEESLKALRAAPHDMLEDIKPMEEIAEESTESEVSSDDDGETPEFVPSAWDKYATPTKSALRSPEKSLERVEHKKSKGVWFKKQKYHCVYEYPREPESPVLQSQDLWKPQTDFTAFTEWEFDAETYLPPPTGESDISPSTFTFKPKINNSRRSLYFLTSLDGQGAGTSNADATDEDFIISSSSNPFDINPLCSQFFPGSSNWIENVTPDSGLDDSTPGSVSDASEFSGSYQVHPRQVLSLRKLAEDVIKLSKQEGSKGSKDALGGLRHTRNKLKLDLPPSPSAFTSSRTFTIEPSPEPIVLREKPTFSTFGKSRFLVQQVDTPTESNAKQKNVCFDVLPYKPLELPPEWNPVDLNKPDVVYEPLKQSSIETSRFSNKKEIFTKGEASLLDSADEDSGIESSTLERKISEASKEQNVKLQ